MKMPIFVMDCIGLLLMCCLLPGARAAKASTSTLRSHVPPGSLGSPIHHDLPKEGWLSVSGPQGPVFFLPKDTSSVEVGDYEEFDIIDEHTDYIEGLPTTFPPDMTLPKTDSPIFDLNLTDATGAPSRPEFRLERALTNITKESGESVKLKCDVVGGPGPIHFRWYKNEAPVEEEKGRLEIRKFNSGSGRVGSRLKISNLDTHDTGYYKCEALEGPNHRSMQPPRRRLESTGILIVKAGRIQPPAAIPNFPPVFPHFPALGGSFFEREN